MFVRAVVTGLWGGDKNQIDVVSLHGYVVEHMQAATNGVNILTLELRNYDSRWDYIQYTVNVVTAGTSYVLNKLKWNYVFI